ncbi:MAG: 4Fe-4S dicluster domain-containing protein [Deltaproteobacteria bacterium]|nr:4Fe-4S dicluster domain-containing protein [Deltaproteobacteria bacterium]
MQSPRLAEVLMEAAQPSSMKVDPNFANLVESITHLNLTSCFQCRKCTNGCPVTFAMDIYPDQVIRLAILGQKEQVLNSSTIWVCSACETCTTRCPNEVDIAATMDALKEMAVKEGIQIPEPKTYREPDAIVSAKEWRILQKAPQWHHKGRDWSRVEHV